MVSRLFVAMLSTLAVIAALATPAGATTSQLSVVAAVHDVVSSSPSGIPGPTDPCTFPELCREYSGPAIGGDGTTATVWTLTFTVGASFFHGCDIQGTVYWTLQDASGNSLTGRGTMWPGSSDLQPVALWITGGTGRFATVTPGTAPGTAQPLFLPVASHPTVQGVTGCDYAEFAWAGVLTLPVS